MHPRPLSLRAVPRRLRWAWAFLAVLAPTRAAGAEEPAPVEVVVKPGGQDWSIGDHGGGVPCAPSCILHLPPHSYRVTMGDTSEEVLIDVPSEVEYRPTLRPLRYTGFGLIGVGLVVGGLLTYGAVKSCSNGTAASFCTSRATQDVFAAVAAASFGAAVAGGFMAYLGGESIRVRDLPPSTGGPRAPSRFTLAVSGQGASLGWSAQF